MGSSRVALQRSLQSRQALAAGLAAGLAALARRACSNPPPRPPSSPTAAAGLSQLHQMVRVHIGAPLAAWQPPVPPAPDLRPRSPLLSAFRCLFETHTRYCICRHQQRRAAARTAGRQLAPLRAAACQMTTGSQEPDVEPPPPPPIPHQNVRTRSADGRCYLLGRVLGRGSDPSAAAAASFA